MFKTLLPIFVLAPAALAQFALNETKDGRLEVTDAGRPVLTYNFGPQLKAGAPEDRRRCCYIYPVYTPDGVSPLDDFPKDHYHHRGLFWGWPGVETPTTKGDSWLVKDVAPQFEKWISKKATRNRATIEVLNSWQAGGKKIVDERVKITVHPAQNGARDIDVVLTLTATGEPVTISGSHDKGKSYGGFSARFAHRENTRITTSDGPLPKDEDLNPHAWAELSATYQGKPATLRITPDPKNQGAPNQWCLRNYGFVGASFPGRTDKIQSHTLQPHRPLTLRYKIGVRRNVS